MLKLRQNDLARAGCGATCRRPFIDIGVPPVPAARVESNLESAMKTRLIKFFTHAVFALATAAASVTAGAQSDRTINSPLALVDVWTATAPFRDGTLMTTRVTLTQNQKFYGSATVNGKPVWTFSGRWDLRSEGSTDVLTWTYEQSVPELPVESKIDRDDVIAVDGAKMILRSRLGGKDNVFTRMN